MTRNKTRFEMKFEKKIDRNENEMKLRRDSNLLLYLYILFRSVTKWGTFIYLNEDIL